MIHARIDTVEHRQLLGFETGTRAHFDKRRGGNPLWVFVDHHQVNFQVNRKEFLINPQNYQVDMKGNLSRRIEPPIIIPDVVPPHIPGYVPLRGEDGSYLTGEDGNWIYGYEEGYNPPPEGFVYLLDSDLYFLTDEGEFLIEPLVEVIPLGTFIVDGDGSFIIDTDFMFITE